MKRRRIFPFILAILVIVSRVGQAAITYGPLTITADVTGPAIWGVGADTINPHMPFNIVFTENYLKGPTDSNRATWSSGFQFSGTNITIEWTDTSTWVPAQFQGYFDVFDTIYVESWANGLPDRFNYSGIANNNGVPGGPFNFIIAGATATLTEFSGQLCVEIGDFNDDAFDWLFDDPMPTFTKKCWAVYDCGNEHPHFTNCPSTLTTQYGAPFNFDFNASDPENDQIRYSIISGPGSINQTTGIWTWNPPCDSVGIPIQLEVCASGPFWPCPYGAICAVDLTVTGGCSPGDADSSGTLNPLDVTYLINFLYKHGPAPRPDSLCSGDADCNCATNILDITYLINNLYKHGPTPCACGNWYSSCP